MNMVIMEGVLARPADLRASAAGNMYLFNTIKSVETNGDKTYTSYIPFKAFGTQAEEIANNSEAKLKLIGKVRHGKKESGNWETEIFINKVEVVGQIFNDAVEVDEDDLPF